MLAPLVSGISYGYLVLGGLGVIILISTVFIFYNEQRTKDKITKESSSAKLDDSASTL